MRRVIPLAVVLLGLAGCGSAESGSGSSTADDTSSAAVDAGTELACPDPATPIPYPPAGRLPEGAVGARLCNTVEHFGGATELQVDVEEPADELTTGVDSLVDLVNAAPAQDDEMVCTAEAGADLAVWFRYDDGSAYAVVVESYGCHWLRTGPDRRRQGGADLDAAFPPHPVEFDHTDG